MDAMRYADAGDAAGDMLMLVFVLEADCKVEIRAKAGQVHRLTPL